MKKFLKSILLFIIILITSYSFYVMYNDFNDYIIATEISDDSAVIIYDYNSSSEINDDQLSNKFSRLVKENDLTLYSYEIDATSGLIKVLYYNESRSRFDDLVDDYNSKCNNDCTMYVKVDFDEINLLSSISLYSEELITQEMIDKYGIPIYVFTETNHIKTSSGYNLAVDMDGPSFDELIAIYRVYIISNILSVVAIILVLLTLLFDRINDAKLHSVFGYGFKSYMKTFFSNQVYGVCIALYILFTILVFIFALNIEIILYSTLYFILVLLLALILFILLSSLFYFNLKRNVEYNFFKFFIPCIGLIVSILTALSLVLISSSFLLGKTYVTSKEVFNANEGYYSVTHDMTIPIDINNKMANYLIEEFGGTATMYMDYSMDSEDTTTPVLRVLPQFFIDNPQITLKDGSPLVIELPKEEDKEITETNGYQIVTYKVDTVYDNAYVKDKSLLSDTSNWYEVGKYKEVVEITDDGREYEIIDFMTPKVLLDQVIVEIISGDELLMSTVYIKASNSEEADKIFDLVYEEFGVERTIDVYTMADKGVVNEASNEFVNALRTSTIAIVSLIISNSILVSILFLRRREQIILSRILGQNYFHTVKWLLLDYLILIVTTTVLIIFIGKVNLYVYGSIMLLLLIVLNIKVISLIKKNVPIFIKEEM